MSNLFLVLKLNSNSPLLCDRIYRVYQVKRSANVKAPGGPGCLYLSILPSKSIKYHLLFCHSFICDTKPTFNIWFNCEMVSVRDETGGVELQRKLEWKLDIRTVVFCYFSIVDSVSYLQIFVRLFTSFTIVMFLNISERPASTDRTRWTIFFHISDMNRKNGYIKNDHDVICLAHKL